MKFIHTADLHIGKTRVLDKYLERQILMLDGIFEATSNKSDGLVVIVGDVFDSINTLPKEKDAFLSRLAKADEEGITTLILNGNHDLIDETDGGYTHLRTVKNLISSNRLKNTYCVESEPSVIYIAKYKSAFVCVPAFYRKSKEMHAILSSLYRQAKENYPEANIYAAIHEAVIGCLNETGFPFNSGIKLSSSIPFKYIALGDIHKSQQIEGIPYAWYSGCPIQHDFSDSENRGVLLVDSENPENPDFINLNHLVPRLLTVKVDEDTDSTKLNFPSNAYIRAEGSVQALNKIYFPSNVISKKASYPDLPATVKITNLDDLFGGMSEILTELGVPPAGLEYCLETLEKLR